MKTQTERLPIEAVTDPILLWLFKHGFEDPGWGQSEMGQLTLNLVIYDLAGKLTEGELRNEIRTMTAKAVGKAAQRLVEE